MTSQAAILFTAFEPSGDDHAAAVISKLLAERPGLTIYALGGPKMEAAGATLIETTTERAHMLTGALGQVQAHRERLKRLAAWLEANHVRVHIPVDSPAANWSICKLVRKHMPGARIIHLVAPQMWAWAPWRVGKMRRLSDHALCLLPFEPEWFARHGVDATFIGHPLYDPDHAAPARSGPPLPRSELRLAILPGSRKSEVDGNLPGMLEAFERAREEHPHIVGVIAARNEETRAWIEEHVKLTKLYGDARHCLQVCVGRADEVIDWATLVLVTSGTASLQVAARSRPMVIVYRTSRLLWYSISWWLLKTRTFGLPNVIAERQGMGRIVPEVIPYFGDSFAISDELDPLLRAPDRREKQLASLEKVSQLFEGKRYGQEAAAHILSYLPDEDDEQASRND